MFCNDLSFVHVVLFVADDLIILMALAGKQYYIIGHMVVNRPFYRLNSVTYNFIPVFPAFYARNYLIYDLLRILGSGVIARHDDKIGVIGGYRSHDGALCSVTVAAAAKEDDKSPIFAGSQCLECVFEGIRRVGHSQ